MSLDINWQQILLRLALSLMAGVLIGINREERGGPAGLRTTTLVCLAASIAMIQANLLMTSFGKAADSFVVLDLMRLPLGILSGIGFIGAGAILRRPEGVKGITTAATIWFTTVMGLCFGGGQLGLGCAALFLGLSALWGLKKVERHLHAERHGALSLSIEGTSFQESEVRRLLSEEYLKITSCSISTSFLEEPKTEIYYEIKWRERSKGNGTPVIPMIYEKLRQRPNLFKKLSWQQF